MPKTYDARMSKRGYDVRLPEPLEAKVKARAAALGLKTLETIRVAVALGLEALDHQGRGKDAA